MFLHGMIVKYNREQTDTAELMHLWMLCSCLTSYFKISLCLLLMRKSKDSCVMLVIEHVVDVFFFVLFFNLLFIFSNYIY